MNHSSTASRWGPSRSLGKKAYAQPRFDEDQGFASQAYAMPDGRLSGTTRVVVLTDARMPAQFRSPVVHQANDTEFTRNEAIMRSYLTRPRSAVVEVGRRSPSPLIQITASTFLPKLLLPSSLCFSFPNCL